LAASPRPACTGNLDVIKFRESSFEMAGDIVSENEQKVVMTPENGGRIELRRELIDKIEYDARPPKQVTTDELVDGFTHCVSRLIGGENTFRVVKVTPEAVYLSLGVDEGVHSGIELNVYREGEELVNPDTGVSLGKDKKFVGVVQIIFAEKEFSKAVPMDAGAETIKEGDTGVYLRKSPVLAIAGITTQEGEESPYGGMLSEKLIGKFNENPDLRVVERRQLGKVLRELAIQNALLNPNSPEINPAGVEKREAALGPLDIEQGRQVDEALADKLKEIQGADAIIFGTVTDVEGRGAVNLRVVDTSTAAILFSTYHIVGNPEKPIEVKEVKDSTQEVAGGSDSAEKKTTAEPVKNTGSKVPDLLDRILRAIYQR
jgi:curli biogenesis system outer membrane secretion channel CsgG